MLVEITGAGWHNAGAQLMLEATAERLLQHGIQPAISHKKGTRSLRRRNGCWDVVDLSDTGRYGRGAPLIRRVVDALPLRERALKVTSRRNVAFVLDASGFGFSDQRGLWRTDLLANLIEAWLPRGTRFVLLPQAFGPFEDPRIRDRFRVIVDNADLIYARDGQSERYLKETYGDRASFRKAPDFTTLLPARPTPGQREGGVVVIPNQRMLDSTAPEVARSYLPFMAACVHRAAKYGLQPTVLVHEKHDPPLARELAALIPGADVVCDLEPVRAKAVLGRARLAIGSRFHALVGSLSQAVPTIGTGWSHKYRELFEDYSCADLFFDPAGTTGSALDAIDHILTDEVARSRLVERLRVAAKRQLSDAEEMWREVFKLLDRSRQAATPRTPRQVAAPESDACTGSSTR